MALPKSSPKATASHAEPGELRLVSIALSAFLSGTTLIGLMKIAAFWYKNDPYLQARNLYLLSLVLVLPLCLLANEITKRVVPSFSAGARNRIVWGAITLNSAALVYFTKYQKEFLKFSGWGLVALTGLFVVIGIVISGTQKTRAVFKKVTRGLLAFALIAEMAVLFLNHTYGFLRVPGKISDPGFQIDFNATYYSIVQALQGSLPFFDYQAQYGNYALFFIPLRLFSPSISTVVVMVSCLILIAAGAIFLATQDLFKNRSLQYLVLAIIPYNYYFVHQETYWANLPIRLLFPSLIFLGATRYFIRRRSSTYFLTMVLGVLAPVWNLDTGIPAMLSWLLALSLDGYLDASDKSPLHRKIARPCFEALLLQGLVLLGVVFYYLVARGRLPILSEAFRSQDLYFSNGFNALPLIPFDSWIIVPLVYLVSFCYCFWAINDRKEKAKPILRVTLFLTLYGCGVFSYFIMRSHFNCLLAVCWPALLLLGIFVDRFLDGAKPVRWITVPAIGLFGYLWVNAISGLFLSIPKSSVQERGMAMLKSQREFVSSLGVQGKPILILSDKSCLFYSDLHSIPVLPIQSASELVAPEDVDLVERYVRGDFTAPRRILFDTSWYLANTPRFQRTRMFLSLFPPKAVSADGKLYFYSD